MDNLENIDVSNMDVSTMSKVIERLWPKFLDAGMNIVWAVLILIVGLKLISILRKFLKKTLLRGNVDTGVVRDDIRDEFKCCNVYAKDKCKKCFAKFYCSGGCAANSYNFHGNINDAYDIGCELQRKRIECAIMLKAAEAAEASEE